MQTPAASDIQRLFNLKAHSWQSKYGPGGELHPRVGLFTARLSALCSPPGGVLDLGCGTGEIAAAIGHLGYAVTACDLSEEMIEIARRTHAGTAVNWIRLKPNWKTLPFEDASFNAVVASSVFEYLVDVDGVAAELSRVLGPGGVLLATVPNPYNFTRKVEGHLRSLVSNRRLAGWLRRTRRGGSYANYLWLSRNRSDGGWWRARLSAADFTPIDESDFSKETWLRRAKATLILLAVRRTSASRVPTAPELRGVRE